MRYPGLWKQSISFLCILVIGGCATFRFAPPPPSIYTQQTYTPEEYKADLALYQGANATVAEKTKFRDKIVYSTASEIDKNYREFKNSFFGEHAATETMLDITQIGLGTAGTIAGGLSTVNLLAAISTGLAGSRLSFNKNFFKEKSPDLLLSRMDALRAEQWSQIDLKLKKDDSAYSLYEAERDVFAYFEKGSLQAAFQNIIAESGAAQQKADNEIKKQIRAKYGESLGPLAPASDLAEVDGLYEAFLKLTAPEKTSRAKKILEEFRKLQPGTPINSGAAVKSDVDDVKYLYSVAIQEDFSELRKALVSAFKVAAKP
ncbi:MAG: hypothetical protein V1897_10125 [Pseudomonadota bacterium]